MSLRMAQVDVLANTTYRFSFATRKWESLPKMNLARAYHSSCCTETALYVFYGRVSYNYKAQDAREIEAGKMNASIERLAEPWRHLSLLAG